MTLHKGVDRDGLKVSVRPFVIIIHSEKSATMIPYKQLVEISQNLQLTIWMQWGQS